MCVNECPPAAHPPIVLYSIWLLINQDWLADVGGVKNQCMVGYVWWASLIFEASALQHMNTLSKNKSCTEAKGI